MPKKGNVEFTAKQFRFTSFHNSEISLSEPKEIRIMLAFIKEKCYLYNMYDERTELVNQLFIYYLKQ